MKFIALITILLAVAGPAFAADDDLAELKAALTSAEGQRNTGTVLTVLGAVALGGGFASYIIGYVAFFSRLVWDFATLSPSDATGLTVWLAASITAMAVGSVGLGVGIPFLIVGNVRYNRTLRQIKERERAGTLSLEPFVAVDPYPFRFRAGFVLSL